MKTLLHVIASPRGEQSRTLAVADVLLARFRNQFPQHRVDALDLFSEDLPELTLTRVDGKYQLLSGKELTGEVKQAWAAIEGQIERFLAADIYVISAPMWNFGIPYRLKHYIDVLLQPGYLFRYTEQGPEGLVKGRQMVVVTSSGGDYGDGSPAQAMNHVEPYLRTVFGFAGIQDIHFITAQPMDAGGADLREARLAQAQAAAREFVFS